MNRRSFFYQLILILSSLSLLVFSEAEARSGKTVGELLKNINRYDRGGSLKKSSSKSRTQVPTSFLPQRKKKKVNLTRIKPPKTSRLLYSSDANLAQLEKITDEGIKELFTLVRKFKNSRNRGELWLRLAELYNEKAKLIEFRLQDEYDLKLKEFFAKKRRKRPQLNLRASAEYYNKSIHLYNLYLRDFKNSSKEDQVLYYLGSNYFQINKFTKGSKYYELLSKKYPKSPYVSEAQFYLGEFNFENERWSKALYYFNKVLKRRGSRLYSFALYKSSWCLFRQGQIGKALQRMEMLVSYRGKRQSVRKLRLGKEALKDLVVFYAEGGNYKKAVSFFRQRASRDVRKYLEKLAYIYADKGDREASRTVFKNLIREKPDDSKAFDYQHQIVLGYSHASKSRLFREELSSWVRTYGKGGLWYEANLDKPEVIKKSDKLIESTLRNYVLRQHKTAQNARSVFAQRLAENGYKRYIKRYSESGNGLEMQFFYGELLYDSKKYEKAAEQYKYVAVSKRKNKYRQRAAGNYLLSLEKGLPTDKSIQRKVGKSLKQVAFDSRVTKFEEGAKWFLSKYPQDKKRRDIMFRLGRLYYLHNRFDPAIKIFKEITLKYPRTKYAEYSANLLLDIYNLRGDYDGLEKIGKELLSNPYLAKSSVGAQVRGVIEKSSFKRAQNLQGEKSFLKSATMFEKFALANARSSLALSARFNAGVNYIKGGATLKGVDMYLAVLKSPVSKRNKGLKDQASEQLAILYSDLGDYKKAAEISEHLGQRFERTSRQRASDYYFNAAVIWDGFRYWSRALKNYDSYLRLIRGGQGKQVYYIKGEIYRKRGHWKSASTFYEKYLNSRPGNTNKIIEVQYRLSQAYKNRRNTGKWRYWLNQAVATLKKYNRSQLDVVWGVRAELERISEELYQLKRLKIPSGSQQQRVVQKKLSLLASINKSLQGVVALDYPEGIVGALTIAGAAHQHMARSFEVAPLPRGLNKAEQEQYRKGIREKLVKPQLEKSIASYRSAIAKGKALDEFSDWYRASERALGQLVPDQNNRQRKPSIFVGKDTLSL